jgi:hypothetical protein
MSSLFGGGDASKPLKKFKPVGFDAGGLDASFNKKNKKFSVSQSEERLGRVASLADVFRGGGRELEALQPIVAPGFSQLRNSRLQQIESDRTRTIGNLSDNLARRRVSGSSFGVDALARAEREFSDQKDRVIAETTLQELAMTDQLIKEKTQMDAQAIQTFITEYNIQADIALQLSTNATSNLAQTAIATSQAIQAGNDNMWDFVGTLVGAGTGLYGNKMVADAYAAGSV